MGTKTNSHWSYKFLLCFLIKLCCLVYLLTNHKPYEDTLTKSPKPKSVYVLLDQPCVPMKNRWWWIFYDKTEKMKCLSWMLLGFSHWLLIFFLTSDWFVCLSLLQFGSFSLYVRSCVCMCLCANECTRVWAGTCENTSHTPLRDSHWLHLSHYNTEQWGQLLI